MDPPPVLEHIENLVQSAVFFEVNATRNPYLTLETFIQRLYRKIADQTRVQPCQNERSLLFAQWHEEILETYRDNTASLSHDEKVCVERVLSRDSPSASELLKFALCWYKHHPAKACRLFAVDGLLGTHPKYYVPDAFSATHAGHNEAVRALYGYFTNPETIREILEKVAAREEDEPSAAHLDPEFEACVRLYAERVGKEERERVLTERRDRRQQQQQQAPKRRRSPEQRP